VSTSPTDHTKGQLGNLRKPVWVLLSGVIALPYLAGGGYLLSGWLERPKISVYSGGHGDLYYQLGGRVAEALNTGLEGKLRFDNVVSQGSNENVERIERGEPVLALAQYGLEADTSVKVLARLYKSPLHIVVRKDLGLTSIQDLKRPKNYPQSWAANAAARGRCRR
jgi:TRAP-type uncharacterized transport system substrate-binding protein